MPSSTAIRPPSAPAAALRLRPQLALAALVLCALAIAFSPIFVRLSEVGPTATGFYRAILAVPPIWLWWRFMPALPKVAEARIAGQPRPLPPLALIRSVERRVGQECVRTC